MLKTPALSLRTGDPERSRLSAIRRRWMRLTQRIPVRIARWAGADFVAMTYQMAGLATLLLLVVDEALWRVDGMVEWFLPARAFLAHRPTGAWMASALAVTWVANSILLHGWIEKRMPPPLPCRPQVILLRFLAGGMPLLGLYVLPIWRRLLDRRPACAFQVNGSDALRPGRSRRMRISLRGHPARWLLSTGPMTWLLAVSFVVLWLGALWLSYPEPPGGERSRSLLALSAGVHLLVFVAIAVCLRDDLREAPVSRSRLFFTVPFLFLPPVPYLPLLGFILIDRLRKETGPARTLIHPVLQRRTQATRLPLWLALEDTLHHRRPRNLPDDQPALATAERKVLRLYELKTLALGLDAGALGWAMARLAGIRPEWAEGIQWLLKWAFRACLGLSALAFLVATAHYLSVLFRRPGPLRVLDRHPYVSFLARTQFAFAVGLQSGYELGMQTAGLGLLAVLLKLLIILFGVRLILTVGAVWTRLAWRRLPDMALSLLPSVAVGLAVAYVSQQTDQVAAIARLPALWTTLSLLLGLVLSTTLLPWLTRPNRPEQLFAHDTPARLRVRLALLTIPAMLPLGGLAVPLWIHLRRKSLAALGGSLR